MRSDILVICWRYRMKERLPWCACIISSWWHILSYTHTCTCISNDWKEAECVYLLLFVWTTVGSHCAFAITSSFFISCWRKGTLKCHYRAFFHYAVLLDWSLNFVPLPRFEFGSPIIYHWWVYRPKQHSLSYCDCIVSPTGLNQSWPFIIDSITLQQIIVWNNDADRNSSQICTARFTLGFCSSGSLDLHVTADLFDSYRRWVPVRESSRVDGGDGTVWVPLEPLFWSR
jgi:hypothetical protein